MSNHFWEEKDLSDFTEEEWEAICMNCGKCCLIKLQDEDSEEIYYTKITCRYFDKEHCKCSEYQNRCTLVPACLKLTKANLGNIPWMPKTCAYRTLYESKTLPAWHPLLTGKRDENHNIKNFCINEKEINPDDIEDHIIDWDEL